VIDFEILSDNQLTNRSKIRIGRKDISKNTDALILVMEKGKPTQAIIYINPDKLKLKTKNKPRIEKIQPKPEHVLKYIKEAITKKVV